MKVLPESNEGWANYYDHLREKADDCYQDSGDPKYATRSYKYGCCADAFRVAADKGDWKAVEKQKRVNAVQRAIDNLVQSNYTKDEVKKILMDVMYI